MTIQERLQADLKEAMKAKERLRVQIIRDARAALQRAQQDADKARYDAVRAEIVASGLSDNPADADESGRTPLSRALDEMQIEPVPLTEEEQQDVLAREVKRRRDAAETYAQAGQTERQQQEESEAQVLET